MDETLNGAKALQLLKGTYGVMQNQKDYLENAEAHMQLVFVIKGVLTENGSSEDKNVEVQNEEGGGDGAMTLIPNIDIFVHGGARELRQPNHFHWCLSTCADIALANSWNGAGYALQYKRLGVLTAAEKEGTDTAPAGRTINFLAYGLNSYAAEGANTDLQLHARRSRTILQKSTKSEHIQSEFNAAKYRFGRGALRLPTPQTKTWPHGR